MMVSNSARLSRMRFCATSSASTYMYVRISVNHNSLGCEQPQGLDDVLTTEVTFQPIPCLISCAGVTGSVGVHAHVTQMLHVHVKAG